MKKLKWMTLLGLVLMLALCAPALAKTTSVVVDGKSYTLYGNDAIHAADGKTFIINGDEVLVQEPGKPDRAFPLEHGLNDEVVEDISQGAEIVAETALEMRDVSGPVSEAVSESVYSAIHDGSITSISGGYEDYAQFGLSYDARADKLYYQGQLVRVFTDHYEIDETSACAVEHFDPQGVIDVEALRDTSAVRYNPDGSHVPGGVITGLKKWNDADFAKRDLKPWTDPQPGHAEASSEGIPMTPTEKLYYFEPYASLGIHYDTDTDLLTYQGKTVRRFLDVKASNGEPFASGRFQGTMTNFNQDTGEIDITILRDYSVLDQSGFGKITGVGIEDAK